MNTWTEIAQGVADSRVIHEGLLRASELESTAGTCLYAALVLSMSLEKFFGCDAVVRGGDGIADGGALDAQGQWRGHYWVEGVTATGVAFVADVTADQFGHEPVYFERTETARGRYQPGNDDVVGEAVRDLVQLLASQACST